MKTNGTIFIKGNTVLFCEGEGIRADTKCSRVSIQGKAYDVLDSTVRNSISDTLILSVMLAGKVDIPNGEDVTIL